MFRQTVYQVTSGNRRYVVDAQRVEQSLAFGEVAPRVPVALERRRVICVVVVVSADAHIEISPVARWPVVDAESTSAAGEHDHSDEDDRVDADDNSEVLEALISDIDRAG